MSQRLLKDIARTKLIAMGFAPLFGAEDGDGGEGGQGNEGGNENGNTGGDGGDDDGIDDAEYKAALQRKLEGVADEKDRRIIALSNENSRRRNEAKTLKTELAEARAAKEELDKIKRKENTDLQNAAQDLTKANEKLSKYETQLRKTMLKEAIRDEDAFTWHDLGDVVSALDLDALEIDLEEGTIEGLGPELKRIAASKPHYVKSKKSDRKKDEGKTDGNGTGGTIGSSGMNPGGTGSPNNAAAARREELLKKYPALRNAR